MANYFIIAVLIITFLSLMGNLIPDEGRPVVWTVLLHIAFLIWGIVVLSIELYTL